MSSPSFGRHFFCLCALFVLGGGIFMTHSLPLALCFLPSAALSIPLTSLSFKLLSPKGALSARSGAKKCFYLLLYLSAAVWGLFCLAESFSFFVRFAADLLIKNGSLFFPVIIFSLVIGFLFFKGKTALYKYALISFFLSLAILLFCFISFWGNFDAENLPLCLRLSATDLGKTVSSSLSAFVFPCLVIPLAAPEGKSSARSGILGLTLGFLLVLGIIISCLLIFGPRFYDRLEYPFAAAVSTITLGRLFTRPDYISYYIYFISSLARCSLLSFGVAEALKRIKAIFRA